jgi:two-component system NtrC family sensor kinase
MDSNYILIVDDTPINLKVLSATLQDSGLKILTASSGEDAIAKLQEAPPEIVLLDVMMPGMDGFETCRRIKINPETRDIPIIFMTALTDLDDKTKAFQLGAVDYIVKPFQKQEVIARVNVHLQLRKLNKNLEQQVEKRTEELTHTLKKLQQTQIQLIQSEKMSALGQLIAGIAHEINNPINFIHGNLPHARTYTQELLDLVNLHDRTWDDPPVEIRERMEAANLPFLQEDLSKVLTSMQVGVDRILGIVQSLRHFSRLDEAECKNADLHEGIDSALMILGSRLRKTPERPTIKIVRDYGDLPLIECYASQLNQVFMNLLINAIDAIDEKNAKEIKSENPAEILISTDVNWDEEIVIVRIRDNGIGIPEGLTDKIFDPFITTKPVGKGTGLGLSIGYQIVVDKHGGQLSYTSEPGQGTEFAIALPICLNNPPLALG